MKKIFIDTSALVALFDKSESRHSKAVTRLQLIKKHKLTLFLSDYVFDETVTTLLSRAGFKSAVQAGNFMLNSNLIELVWLTQESKIKAWEYFNNHSDKVYSFTDCTSFVLMDERGQRDFFAFDDDFNKAGFTDFPLKY